MKTKIILGDTCTVLKDIVKEPKYIETNILLTRDCSSLDSKLVLSIRKVQNELNNHHINKCSFILVSYTSPKVKKTLLPRS